MFNLKFPREIANPHRYIVKDLEEYLQFINKNNGITNLYTNVWNAPVKLNQFGKLKSDFSQAEIDRLYFDCDKIIHLANGDEERPNDGYDDLIAIHNWCKKYDYINYPYLSGNGYHIYIATDTNEFIQNPKACLYNAQMFIEKECNIRTDPKVYGQTERISRIPFTYHLKAKRFSIPLTPEIIYKGNTEIKKFAENWDRVKTLLSKSNKYGNKYWNIKQFDTQVINYSPSFEIDIETLPSISEDINCEVPICIKHLLSNPEMNFESRRIVIVWLKEMGYTYKEVEAIMKKYLTPAKFNHMMHETVGGQIKYIYQREAVKPFFFESFKSMKMKGLCPFAKESDCGLHIKYE